MGCGAKLFCTVAIGRPYGCIRAAAIMAFQAVIDGPVVGMRWTAIVASDDIADLVLRWQGPTKHPAQVDRWRKMVQRRQQGKQLNYDRWRKMVQRQQQQQQQEPQ